MLKPQFPFGVQVQPLDNPADMREFRRLFQAEPVQVEGKIAFTTLLAYGLEDA